MIELVALDIAGTTVAEGGAVYRVLAEVVADHGTPAAPAEIQRWMGADKRAALAELTGDPDSTERLHDEFVARLRAAYVETPPKPVPGVPEALALLREKGIRVALTTGFDHQVTDPLLAAIGWRVGDQLDAVVCADDVAAGRPEPHMIRRAMELTGVTDPQRVLAAGDTVLDIRAGRAAEAALVVGVLSGAQSRSELEPENPTEILADVSEIPALLQL
ncbi:phosphonatase-like hydrolase [Actinoalloteichus hymeniacidonis]|uniref:Phosphonatase-like hydrolase n=1 Tax=Actinoalloteichus hymeniacidonis TaxID=340345 RepID=A0AAC9MXA2_9PSEU|nr:phosphonatase-like hydrolase [Actinoalloteichus hymeniacidonis]AOS62069.1 phosphonatase-like hydrolase [Actinoalloteichus hymeniacidonis]MBB5909909.1 phosphonatase-like hydrolase [Actinoalloteichus hymeniacidonis]